MPHNENYNNHFTLCEQNSMDVDKLGFKLPIPTIGDLSLSYLNKDFILAFHFSIFGSFASPVFFVVVTLVVIFCNPSKVCHCHSDLSFGHDLVEAFAPVTLFFLLFRFYEMQWTDA